MNIRSLVFAASAVLLAWTDGSAQTAHAEWAVEYPTRVASRNGESHVEAMGTATLIFDRVSGDSIYGSWRSVSLDDPSKKNDPRRVAGTLSNGKLVMVAAPVEAQIRRSMAGGGTDEDHPSSIIMLTYYEGTVTADTIEGTMYSATDDRTIMSSPVKWSAKRVK